MVSVAIVSPLEIWSTGMGAILQSIGFTVVGRWTDHSKALAAAELPGVDLLILARRLIEVSGRTNPFRPLDGDYGGKITTPFGNSTLVESFSGASRWR